MKTCVLLFLGLILSCSFIGCNTENNNPSVLKVGVSGKIVNVANFPLRSVSLTITDKTAKKPAETAMVNGEYLLLLDTGHYSLDVKVKGYQLANVALDPLQKDTVLNFTLTGKSLLSGKVVSAQTGDGIPGAKISFVRDTASAPVRGEYQVEFATETDIDGDYDLSALPSGKFIGIIEKAGYTMKKTDVIELVDGSNTAPLVSL